MGTWSEKPLSQWLKAVAAASLWTKPPFHDSNKSIESYRRVKMSVVAVDAINASICVSSLFHPGSCGDSGLLIVLPADLWALVSSPTPTFHLSILSSPSTSLSHCWFVFELRSPVITAPHLLPAPVAPCQLFDKTFRSSSELTPAARQQWSLCVCLITVSLLKLAWKPPRMLVCLANGLSDVTLYIRTHHQNSAELVFCCELFVLDCQQVRPVLEQRCLEPAST